MTLALVPAGSVRGVVLGADGKPLAKATVFAGRRGVRTDATGRFVIQGCGAAGG